MAFRLTTSQVMAAVRWLGACETDLQLQGTDHLAIEFVPAHVRWLLRQRWGRWLARRTFTARLPGGYGYINAKCRAIDELLIGVLSAAPGIQVMSVGAGYDTRAWRLAAQLQNSSVVEIDRSEQIAAKRRRAARLGLPLEHLSCLVGTVSATEDVDLLGWLQEASLDPGAPTVVILDGLSYFLTPTALDGLFTALDKLAPGSHLIFDYAYAEILDAQAAGEFFGSQAFLGELAAMGEPMRGGISNGEVCAFLASRNWTVRHRLGPRELEQRYLRSSTGEQLRAYGFLELVHAQKTAAGGANWLAEKGDFCHR